MAARRGKPAKAVLAANTRISRVVICSAHSSTLPEPKARMPICASTVRSGSGATPYRKPSPLTTKNMAASIVPMTSMVLRARRAEGSRNTLTPLAIASMPVMAEQPELKARKIRKTPSGSTALKRGGASG